MSSRVEKFLAAKAGTGFQYRRRSKHTIIVRERDGSHTLKDFKRNVERSWPLVKAQKG